MPGFGHLVRVGTSDIGGIFDLAGPQNPQGDPAAIGVMVKVDDVDAMAAKVTELGGEACRRSTSWRRVAWRCASILPANSTCGNRRRPGTDVDGGAIGAPSWFENMTTDVAKCVPFYQSLFGWTPRRWDMGDFKYTTFKLHAEYVAGMMAIGPDMGPIPAHWGVYFNVTDVDGVAQKAAGTGATVVVPPQDIPEVGRFSVIRSPQGVVFCVIRYKNVTRPEA